MDDERSQVIKKPRYNNTGDMEEGDTFPLKQTSSVNDNILSNDNNTKNSTNINNSNQIFNPNIIFNKLVEIFASENITIIAVVNIRAIFSIIIIGKNIIIDR